MMKLILERWNKFLAEDVRFYNSPDEDRPGNKQIIVFDEAERYVEQGSTHGKMSHSIKHYLEFEPEKVSATIDKALEIAKRFDSFILKSIKDSSTIAVGPGAKKQATPNAMLNTFDNINDKVISSIELTKEEAELLPLITGLEKQYDTLVQSYLDAGNDVDLIQNPEQIKSLLDQSKIIKFSGIYGGNQYTYYLNPVNTGLVAQSKDGTVSTLFRIDKSSNSLAKVAGYFDRGVQVKNPALRQVLGMKG